MAAGLVRGAPDAGGYTTSGTTSGACGRRAAVAGGGDPMSLAAAGGRRAWSRTKNYVSGLVIHLIPVRVREKGAEKNRIGGFNSHGDGGVLTLTTWLWRLCDRMVVAIFRESQRHKGDSAVVVFPRRPQGGTRMWVFSVSTTD